MNEKVLFHFIAEKIYLSHNNIMQQHLLHKYSFQRVPNQVEKIKEIPGSGGKGMISKSGGSTKQKCPPWDKGGGRCIDIFKNCIHMSLHLLMILCNCGLQISTMQTCYDECLRTLDE